MKLHYLEVVTPDVDAACAAYAKTFDATFGEPVAELGGARTAVLAGGGTVGVRGPLREDERAVVRPYRLVENIEAALHDAVAAGGTVALGRMPLGRHGFCAIVIQGGVETGLWEV